MLSKNKARFIISLQKKKVREEYGLFVIEGDKLVREFLSAGVKFRMLVAKREFIQSLSSGFLDLAGETEEAGFEELRQISTLKTPHNAIAVVPFIPRELKPEELEDKISLALDCIQDPGNLGTIIRAAAWFGIGDIICSPDSVDVYNPKVVQASMGALLHVNVHYSDIRSLAEYLSGKGIPVFGTLLEGEPVYTCNPGNSGLIILGNESRGISPDLLPFVSKKIMIPGAGRTKPGIDSLNVGMAASVVLSEFQRQKVV
jgi:RNA methyltransferase, TrmH family